MLKHWTEGTTLYLQSPYCKDNLSIFRSAGGRWVAEKTAWAFSVTKGEEVLRNLFGTSEEEVEVLVAKDKGDHVMGWIEASSDGELVIKNTGILLATRKQNDYSANLADGVSLEAGELPSRGGSKRIPRVHPSDDAVFRVKIRKDLAEDCNLMPEPAPASEVNPLAGFSDEMILAEAKRRGLI